MTGLASIQMLLDRSYARAVAPTKDAAKPRDAKAESLAWARVFSQRMPYPAYKYDRFFLAAEGLLPLQTVTWLKFC